MGGNLVEAPSPPLVDANRAAGTVRFFVVVVALADDDGAATEDGVDGPGCGPPVTLIFPIACCEGLVPATTDAVDDDDPTTALPLEAADALLSDVVDVDEICGFFFC